MPSERERWEQERRILVSENVAALGRLAAAVSHEFNSPLGALKSTIDTMSRLSARRVSASPADRTRLAVLESGLRGTLDAAIDRMSLVIGRIQRFTNLDRAETRPVDLNELLRDAIALSEAQPGDKRAEVEFTGGCLPPVTCRPLLLNLVFSCLLNSASRAGRIRVSTRVQGQTVEVLLECDGRGVPSENSRQMIREQGGEIRISRAAGQGTAVVVTLPC